MIHNPKTLHLFPSFSSVTHAPSIHGKQFAPTAATPSPDVLHLGVADTSGGTFPELCSTLDEVAQSWLVRKAATRDTSRSPPELQHSTVKWGGWKVTWTVTTLLLHITTSCTTSHHHISRYIHTYRRTDIHNPKVVLLTAQERAPQPTQLDRTVTSSCNAVSEAQCH